MRVPASCRTQATSVCHSGSAGARLGSATRCPTRPHLCRCSDPVERLRATVWVGIGHCVPL
eukprot:1255200-Alexandrium_andersonii.AAC.1